MMTTNEPPALASGRVTMAGRNWQERLQQDLEQLQRDSLRRELWPATPAGREIHRGGRVFLNLAGNDYLGLAQHPHLIEASVAATRALGTGAGASRLVSGHLPLHAQVEAEVAAWKNAAAALLFPTGYAANLAVLTALTRPGDWILQDKLNHASLLDAGRLAMALHRGLILRTFPHGNLARLEVLLAEHQQQAAIQPRATRSQCFLVTDSVFSMDGDVADLPALCGLAERYNAVLIVDEAHGTGLLGEAGTGLIEAMGVKGRVPVVISTASKALGGLGGIVTAAQVVIDTLVNRARPLIYSTAIPPAQAAAIGAAVEVIQQEPQRRARLAQLSARLRTDLTAAGWPNVEQVWPTPIVPLITGSAQAALRLSARLEAAGIFAPAIRPPTVPPGRSRVRLSLRCDLTDDDLDRLIAAIGPGPAGASVSSSPAA